MSEAPSRCPDGEERAPRMGSRDRQSRERDVRSHVQDEQSLPAAAALSDREDSFAAPPEIYSCSVRSCTHTALSRTARLRTTAAEESVENIVQCGSVTPSTPRINAEPLSRRRARSADLPDSRSKDQFSGGQWRATVAR